MAEKINFADLEDLSDITNIVSNSGIYALLIRKTSPTIKNVYKFNIDLLNTYFLATSDVEAIKNRIKNFRQNLEKITKKFETIDFLEKNNYMLKYDADIYRKNLATEETLKSKLSDYLTKTGLDADEKEAERHTLECVASYTISMSQTAATARATNARNNTSVAKFDELTEAVGSIEVGGDDEDEE